MKQSARAWWVTVCIAATGCVQAAPSVEAMCEIHQRASANEPLAPEAVLKKRALTPTVEERLSHQRACVKSYAHQFPGGLETMMEASPADFKQNLQALRAAFDQPGSAATDGNADVRARYIKGGWSRKQVLLWGSAFMIRLAYRAGDYDGVIAEAAKARKEFNLKPAKLDYWDAMEEHTYFSPEALGNMIISLEYQAKVRRPGTSKADMKSIAADYMRDRDALMPLARFVNNPDAVVFRGICRGKR
ncbi:MAG: hypothetical protein WKG03_01305 [Telluria sp.]